MAEYRYVVVEGPMGVGKRQLAERLAERWGMRLVPDPLDDNPFLDRFLQGQPALAFATQTHSLTGRADVARRMLKGELLAEPVVSDFLFERDALFAELVLDEAEHALYRRLAQAFLPEYPVPDLVIYLQPELERSLARLADLGAPQGLVESSHAAYSAFFHRYERAPLLIVNADHVDLASDEDFELLLRCISDMRGQRSYFNKAV
ncbi:deoxyadenosine/deoxycytidine kinase [Crenobacter luteus]|uniref:Deoxyadenosine kinase n=1 Tax=Crenobacter luteus TaxID=1452487 RepID=A0A165EMB9_9NEIS|nr:deoxynucleoside kinase [Crenobacter luteus]KZE25937.1 deoxyadenosine kinase [Crenobacter luteus]TCP14502.1 deoxyadenosine/deoxycytidine kinase [Crenobacter luteus]